MRDWMNDANCRGMDTNIFFPANGTNYDPFVREVCYSCDVQEQCLLYAVTHSIDFGMYGGMSPKERDAWKTKNRTITSSLWNGQLATLS